jgi:hypothetical protein
LRAIRQDQELANLAKLPDTELRECGRQILKNLSYWLAIGTNKNWDRFTRSIAKVHLAKSIPRHESIHAVLLMKNKMVDFRGLARSRSRCLGTLPRASLKCRWDTCLIC